MEFRTIPVSILPLRVQRGDLKKKTSNPAKHTSTSLDRVRERERANCDSICQVIISIWSQHSVEGSDGGESYRERTYAPWSEPLEQKLALN